MSREHSSVGRASALQAGGHRFEPYCSHQCGNGSVVERYLAKVNVASSNLVSRSIRKPTRKIPCRFSYGAGNERKTELAEFGARGTKFRGSLPRYSAKREKNNKKGKRWKRQYLVSPKSSRYVLYLFFFYGAGNEMSTRLACEPSLAFERSENPAEGSRLRETAVSRFPDIKLIGFVPIPFAMERETREKPNSQSSAPEERSSEEVCRGIPPNGNKTIRRVKGGNGSISFIITK